MTIFLDVASTCLNIFAKLLWEWTTPPQVMEGQIDRNSGAEKTDTEIIRVLNYLYQVQTSRTDISMRAKFDFLRKRNKLGDLQPLKEHMRTDVREFRIKTTPLP